MPAATRVKVLHLINGEFYAGAERVQDLLAAGLPEQGFEVGFACLKQGVFAERRRSRQAPLHMLAMKSRADLLQCLPLARLVRTQSYRLLHTHTPRTALVGRLVALMTGVPMVHHVHSPTERDTEHGWRNRRNDFVERACLRGASRLITVSASLERQLRQRGIAAERIRCIPNGVPRSERLRRGYQAGEELTVGTVALFRPRKGIEILLESLAQLRAGGARVRLRAVGPFESPDYEQSVRALCERLALAQSVTWTGFCSDIGAEFRQMHVFALPSLYGEGMPMVVLEAMAAGLPVVASRVEGIPEVVRHGEDGLLVAPGDAAELAAALRRFIDGAVATGSLGDSAWHRQRESFSDAAMAAAVAAVYREVLPP
jgi:glycosyltransferase involved in cell wall biosynthesis